MPERILAYCICMFREQLPTGLAEHTQDLAVEGQFVDAAGIGVGSTWFGGGLMQSAALTTCKTFGPTKSTP